MHWLPTDKWIDYKIACLTFKCLNNIATSYLCNLINPYVPKKILQSSSHNFLASHSMKNDFKGRVFSISGSREGTTEVKRPALQKLLILIKWIKNWTLHKSIFITVQGYIVAGFISLLQNTVRIWSYWLLTEALNIYI